MGAVVDVLLLGRSEMRVLEINYPHCVIRNMTNSKQLTQKYRLIVPDEDIEDYYGFLVDNRISMSSSNFRARLGSDERFKERMAARAAANRGQEERVHFSVGCADHGASNSGI